MAGEQWRDYRDRAWDGLYGVIDPPGGPSMTSIWTICGRSSPMKPRRHNSSPPSAAQLDPPSRDMFLDYVARDFFAALDTLVRRAEGDFRMNMLSDSQARGGRRRSRPNAVVTV